MDPWGTQSTGADPNYAGGQDLSLPLPNETYVEQVPGAYAQPAYNDMNTDYTAATSMQSATMDQPFMPAANNLYSAPQEAYEVHALAP